MARLLPVSPPDRHAARAGRAGRAGDEARERLWHRMQSAARDVLPLLILAFAVVGVPVLVFEPQGLPRLRSLERDLEQVDAENRAAEREIARLRTQVKLLKDDLSAVEKVARQELGLVRKSEIVFQLPK